jgi:alkaline phosphatase
MRRDHPAHLVAAVLVLLTVACAPGSIGHHTREASPRARNAILFVGDGMSIPTVTAARILAHGPAGRLAMELAHTALVRTYSLDRMVSDSASTATALVSGERVSSGVIGMNAATRPGCSRATRDDGTPNPTHPCDAASAPVRTLLDVAHANGRAVGIVTTTRITHATPAALYAHVDHRHREREIAEQLVAREDWSIAIGGGAALFRPGGSAGASRRDLVAELEDRGVAVARSGDALRRAVEAGAARILALLGDDHLAYELERREQPGDTREPSLAELTQLAIRHLSRQPEGYFLLVEGGRIDHALHGNRAGLALHDTLAFDEAIERALSLVDERDTLVVVTADHGHPLSIAGYPLVDDPVLGLARSGAGVEYRDGDGDGKPDWARALDGKAMTVLQFANGPGHGSPDGSSEREDPLLLDEHLFDPDYAQESAIPLPSSTHEGADVMASAVGPGAERVRGFLDQTQIFAILRDALAR